VFIPPVRKSKPVALAEGLFTPDEATGMQRLRSRFLLHRDNFKLDVSLRQLEFMRWLVQRGHLQGDDDRCDDPHPNK
jgi:hypothetical protein